MITKKRIERMRSLTDNITVGGWIKTEHAADMLKDYCHELLDRLEDIIEYQYCENVTERLLLNGADDWYKYSWGGCSLVYNYDLAKRLLTADEFEEWKASDDTDFHGENLLDIQAELLKIAYRTISDFWDIVNR